MDIAREVPVTLRGLAPQEVTITVNLRVLCPLEDASTLPEGRENRRSGFFWDRFTRTRFFMLRRGNFRRSLDDLLSVKQRLLCEASHVIAGRTAGHYVTLQGQSVDCIFMNSALHLQNVLRSERYSHLQNMPVEMTCKVIMWRRDGLELLSEAAIQESMEYPGGSRAVPATQEAIDALEKTNLNNALREDGSAGEPCTICLEDMNLREVEVACMPCNHQFHHDCLARWLTMSNLCPLCRFAMPTSLSDVD